MQVFSHFLHKHSGFFGGGIFELFFTNFVYIAFEKYKIFTTIYSFNILSYEKDFLGSCSIGNVGNIVYQG